MARDDFSQKTVEALSKRAGYQCSNPECRIRTIGSSEKSLDKHVHIGVAAHITAASPEGPRYNSNLTTEQRRDITNAIYLCSNCANMIDKNRGIDFSVECLLFWKETNESETFFDLKNPHKKKEKKLEQSGLTVLEEWSQSLQVGQYKTRLEIINLFCRYIIPFIQKHSDLKHLVVKWRNDYISIISAHNILEKKVLDEINETFRNIVDSGGHSDQVKSKIADIKEILNGGPGKEGFTSWPKYRQAYWAIKELLQMLFQEGKKELCSSFAKINSHSVYVEKDGILQIVNEDFLSEFTFSTTINEAVESETKLSDFKTHDSALVWSKFERAFYYKNMSKEDINKKIEYLYRIHPLHALSLQAEWLEINQDSSKENEFRIFSNKMFIDGLRILINEVKLFSIESI